MNQLWLSFVGTRQGTIAILSAIYHANQKTLLLIPTKPKFGAWLSTHRPARIRKVTIYYIVYMKLPTIWGTPREPEHDTKPDPFSVLLIVVGALVAGALAIVVLLYLQMPRGDGFLAWPFGTSEDTATLQDKLDVLTALSESSSPPERSVQIRILQEISTTPAAERPDESEQLRILESLR